MNLLAKKQVVQGNRVTWIQRTIKFGSVIITSVSSHAQLFSSKAVNLIVLVAFMLKTTLVSS